MRWQAVRIVVEAHWAHVGVMISEGRCDGDRCPLLAARARQRPKASAAKISQGGGALSPDVGLAVDRRCQPQAAASRRANPSPQALGMAEQLRLRGVIQPERLPVTGTRRAPCADEEAGHVLGRQAEQGGRAVGRERLERD